MKKEITIYRVVIEDGYEGGTYPRLISAIAIETPKQVRIIKPNGPWGWNTILQPNQFHRTPIDAIQAWRKMAELAIKIHQSKAEELADWLDMPIKGAP